MKKIDNLLIPMMFSLQNRCYKLVVYNIELYKITQRSHTHDSLHMNHLIKSNIFNTFV